MKIRILVLAFVATLMVAVGQSPASAAYYRVDCDRMEATVFQLYEYQRWLGSHKRTKYWKAKRGDIRNTYDLLEYEVPRSVRPYVRNIGIYVDRYSDPRRLRRAKARELMRKTYYAVRNACDGRGFSTTEARAFAIYLS